MSKERATPVDRRLVAMQERIEELEREVKRLSKQSANRLIGLCKCGLEREALQADNARLRHLVEYSTEYRTGNPAYEHGLASTPEQSLDALTARIRAEVMEEFADRLETLRDRLKSVIQIQENPS